ncbi:porin [uncultured Parvibaculum sp.]|uniref:porin n=1 Tax=uncultured Parvibaculum sp. TaxID=291828 RepID=UPI0030DAA568|tara:strand:- start:20640 stop:21779 length:1140 start_codon:yes stop_codon:yes gene_type:complete
MKKILLGTTALVSAGLIAGPALASDPLAVTVGGTVTAGFYVIDADDIGATSFTDTAVKLVARNIDIKAEGTLDNGMVAGVIATLSLGDDWNTAATTVGGNLVGGNNNDAVFRELFAYLEGGFGRFEIGGTDGAAFKMHYTSPWFVPGNGLDSPNILNAVLAASAFRHSTFSLMAADANKVTYFTPRFAGFQLGGSYTPETSFNGPNPNGLGLLPNTAVNIGDVFEIALNYAGSFGGVDVGADAFYVSGESGPTAADPEELGFGLNLGMAGFTLGGAWYQSEDLLVASVPVPSAAGVEEEVWTVGLSYGTGPWTVGVAYLTDEISSPGFSAEIESWQAGGGYNLGSGVDVGVDVQMSTINIGGGADIDSTSAGLVLSIGF